MCVCVQCPNETLIICYAVDKRGKINFISEEESRRHEGMFSANSPLWCKSNVTQAKLEVAPTDHTLIILSIINLHILF